nr:chaperone protein DnaJ 1, mitochondrial isoform X1 [Ipomoea batatas]
MAAEPVKSQPLHNFSLAHLKWGHRSHHSFRRRDSPPSAAELNANTVQRRPSPPSGESGPKVPSPGSLPEFPFSVCSTQKRHGEEGETKAWKLRPRKARNGEMRETNCVTREATQETPQSRSETVFPGLYLVGLTVDSYRVHESLLEGGFQTLCLEADQSSYLDSMEKLLLVSGFGTSASSTQYIFAKWNTRQSYFLNLLKHKESTVASAEPRTHSHTDNDNDNEDQVGGLLAGGGGGGGEAGRLLSPSSSKASVMSALGFNSASKLSSSPKENAVAAKPTIAARRSRRRREVFRVVAVRSREGRRQELLHLRAAAPFHCRNPPLRKEFYGGTVPEFQRTLLQSRSLYSSGIIGKPANFAANECPSSRHFIHSTGVCHSAEKDYYDLLGVSKDASREEIKKASFSCNE